MAKTGFQIFKNRFLPISKPVFKNLKIFKNRFLPILKPVFKNLKTGFWKS